MRVVIIIVSPPLGIKRIFIFHTDTSRANNTACARVLRVYAHTHKHTRTRVRSSYSIVVYTPPYAHSPRSSQVCVRTTHFVRTREYATAPSTVCVRAIIKPYRRYARVAVVRVRVCGSRRKPSGTTPRLILFLFLLEKYTICTRNVCTISVYDHKKYWRWVTRADRGAARRRENKFVNGNKSY